MKKIVFQVIDEVMQEATESPVPASTYLPDWYKKMRAYHGTGGLKVENGVLNATAKKCVPLRDAMTAGYFILLNCDVIVSDTPRGKEFSWTAPTSVVDQHLREQVAGFPTMVGYSDKPFKWVSSVMFTTPRGYSCMITHPMNRADLPFYTLSGIVDTDAYDVATHFPFLIREDFTGIISAGTPIAQVIPFKREGWRMEFIRSAVSQIEYRNRIVKLRKKLVSSYRNSSWTKKVYS